MITANQFACVVVAAVFVLLCLLGLIYHWVRKDRENN